MVSTKIPLSGKKISAVYRFLKTRPNVVSLTLDDRSSKAGMTAMSLGVEGWDEGISSGSLATEPRRMEPVDSRTAEVVEVMEDPVEIKKYFVT